MTKKIGYLNEEPERRFSIISLFAILGGIVAVLIILYLLTHKPDGIEPADAWRMAQSGMLQTTDRVILIIRLLVALAIFLTLVVAYLLSLHYLCKWAFRITRSAWIAILIFAFPFFVFIPVLAMRNVKIDENSYIKTGGENVMLVFCVVGVLIPFLCLWFCSSLLQLII